MSLSLAQLARVYTAQKQYDQAEPYLVRAVKNYESLPIPDDINMLIPLSSLCYLYELWGKPEKAEPRLGEAAAAVERVYGPNSQFLVPVLTKQAETLHKLGRNDEATAVEQRIKSIQVTAMN